MSESHLWARLADHWRTHGAAPGTGTSEAAITDFEKQHGVRLPSDLRAYFATLNGLANGRDDMTNETIGFWRLADVVSIDEEAPHASVPDARQCFAIADYLICSHLYAVALSADPAAAARVLFVWREGFAVLASSFEEFITRYIAGDEAILYGVGVVP